MDSVASDNAEAAFLKASVWHGPLDSAAGILAAHPEVAGASIYTAAILGDAAAVGGFLARDSGHATARGGPFGWDALTYLCFSKYLRLDESRSDGFVRAAGALLDAGAPAATGFYEKDHQPEPEFESALYGAAGVAHHAALTRLLLERGADPNDAEVPYHTPETYDNAALEVLVESGKMTGDSLAVMLLRKHDWHDFEGVRYLLDHGADPNRMTRWGRTALDQALLRDNSLRMIDALLNRGADGARAAGLAARQGRGDVLDLFERRGIPVELEGVERLLAACAQNRPDAVRAIRSASPEIAAEAVKHAGELLAAFAGTDNAEGVRLLLDLGLDGNAPFSERDGYWGIGKHSTPLHVAAWRASHATLKLLISRGASVNARDAAGRTPLQLAVRACVDSYWQSMRSPESVAALLAAGASVEGLGSPCGYPEVDELIAGAIG
jgi:ankyrin repeat protein